MWPSFYLGGGGGGGGGVGGGISSFEGDCVLTCSLELKCSWDISDEQMLV